MFVWLFGDLVIRINKSTNKLEMGTIKLKNIRTFSSDVLVMLVSLLPKKFLSKDPKVKDG